MNWKGDLMATASVNGTKIRVWKDSEIIHEFTRGSAVCQIKQLTFCPLNEMLACVSERPKIHIFSLVKENTKGWIFNGEWSFTNLEVTSDNKQCVIYNNALYVYTPTHVYKSLI